jgi:hypothetical protein
MPKKGSRNKSVLLVLIAAVIIVPSAILLFHRGGTLTQHISSTVELDAGFQTFPTPRTFDGPGTVFRIDESGAKFIVVELKIPYEEAGMEQIGTYSRQKQWTIAALVNFLGGHGSNEGSETIESLMKFGEGHRRRITDTDIDQALEKEQIKYKPRNEYFVIHETIAVPSLDVDFRHSESLSPEVKVAFDEAIKAGSALKWSDTSKRSLVKTFRELHNVFFTADKILPPALGAVSPGRPELIKLDPSEQPIWKTEDVSSHEP